MDNGPSATELDLRRRAEQRVDAKLGFRNHAIVFVLVNLGLAILNLVTSPAVLWFLWPLAGWGVGLIAHGLSVYGPSLGSREAAIEAEMKRLRERVGGGR